MNRARKAIHYTKPTVICPAGMLCAPAPIKPNRSQRGKASHELLRITVRGPGGCAADVRQRTDRDRPEENNDDNNGQPLLRLLHRARGRKGTERRAYATKKHFNREVVTKGE